MSHQYVQVHFGHRKLGQFALPPVSETLVPGARRNLLASPEWNDLDNNRVLVWMEDRSGEPEIMTWIPATLEEQTEAKRFFAKVHERSWSSYAELESRPRESGDWLLALHDPAYVAYVATLDEARLSNPEAPSGDEFFAVDPREAAVMTHDNAIRLLRRLMTQFEFAEGGEVYFEPVKLQDAIAAFIRDS